MFSVIIPLFNKEKSIQNTIQSVLDQAFQYFEVVIINDGSTDSSIEKVKAFKDSRIKIINQDNGGVSRARNRGIKEAKYEWIAFLDADDWWYPKKLMNVYREISNYRRMVTHMPIHVDLSNNKK